MSGIASGADTAVEVAVRASQASCFYAGCWPINIPTALTMGKGVGGPFSIATVANQWFQAADHLRAAQERLSSLTSSVSGDEWSGDDRDAFDTEVTQLAAQIGDAQQFATIVAWTLTAEAIPLAEWPVGCVTIGTLQAVNASAYYAAVASVVGNVGASQALYASGLSVAITCNRVAKISKNIVRVLLLAGAATVGAGAIDNVRDQERNGDADADWDLVQASIDLPDLVEHLVPGGDGDEGPFRP